MKKFYAYTRVSTKEQEDGASLSEQQRAIEGYAVRNNIEIVQWFKDTKTAAKRGRAAFDLMLKELKKRHADGMIIHKIDRSSRNGHDWADIGDLLDAGIEVHFAAEALDLNSQGGRLAADMLAVVATAFIRNLKQEIRKGQDGRLKEGLYPWGAPVGYCDMGKGQPKVPDPVQGPLVREAFEKYATGNYNFRTLKKEMDQRGLRGTRGKRLLFDGFTRILNNPFYMGVIHIKKKGESYEGIHRPLISKDLFDRTQRVLRTNRLAGAKWKHDLTFRRMIQCAKCGYNLIGERQKQRYVYYRCHTPNCDPVCVSEATINTRFYEIFSLFAFDDVEIGDMRDSIAKLRSSGAADRERRRAALRLAITNGESRLSRLTDAMLDNVVDRETYEAKKLSILTQRQKAKEELETVGSSDTRANLATTYLEQSNTAYTKYQSGIPEEIREIVFSTTSNLSGYGKDAAITLKNPFAGMYEIRKSRSSADDRDDGRTITQRIFGLFLKAAEDSITDTSPKSTSPRMTPKPQRSPRTGY
jgi:site-specific DNA recombinase